MTRKKNILLLTILFVLILSVNLNAQIFDKARNINAGIGTSSNGIPFYIGIDQEVATHITVGLSAAMNSHENIEGETPFNQNIYSFTINTNYYMGHMIGLPENWNFYGGLNLGMIFNKSEHELGTDEHYGPGIGLQLGSRYFFTPNLAANLELGGGYTATGIRIGISYML